MKEVWKDIPNYEGLYQVSSLGNARSLNYNREKRVKELRPYKNNRGYLAITLFHNNKQKGKMIHRLVAEAFIENKQDNAFVNHKDGNKLNNNVENLEWCTPQYNIKEAFRIGLNKPQKGSEHHLSRKVKQFDNQGNYIKTWNCIKDIEKELGFKTTNISACCMSKTKRAYGYKWEYVKYIEVDKIRDKIEEYQKQITKMEEDDIGIGFTLGKEWSDLKAKVNILKELLEEE